MELGLIWTVNLFAAVENKLIKEDEMSCFMKT